MSVLPPSVLSTLTKLRDSLYKLGIKEPWKVTGSWTCPDYEHFLPAGTHYRAIAPGSQPAKVKVPHDHPSLVYDIKYFVRDHRRNSKWAPRTVAANEPFDFDKLFAAAPLKPDQVKVVPIPPTMPTRGF